MFADQNWFYRGISEDDASCEKAVDDCSDNLYYVRRAVSKISNYLYKTTNCIATKNYNQPILFDLGTSKAATAWALSSTAGGPHD
jgi:hypothetical protein